MRKSLNFRMFVIDLDGTALDRDNVPYARFTPRFSKFLDELDAGGCKWSINTTWDINGQWQLVMNSPLRSKPAFLMAEYGLRLARYSDQEPAMVENYCLAMENRLTECREKSMDRVLKLLVQDFNPVRLLFYGHVINFLCQEKDRGRFVTFCRKHIMPVSDLTAVIDNSKLSIRPSFLSKALPVKEMQKITGISPGETVVAGDEPIDIPMMKPDVSVYPICPANALDAVKDTVIKNGGVVGNFNYSNGVIDAFNKLREKMRENKKREKNGTR